MIKKYDLIVIGTGSAGSITAAKCNKAGWNVAMVDDRPFGGTCALRGCDPKRFYMVLPSLLIGTNGWLRMEYRLKSPSTGKIL